MLLRHGHVVAEGWWAPFAGDLRHELFSVSTSFTATAVGIAIHEGLLAGLSTRGPLQADPVARAGLAAASTAASTRGCAWADDSTFVTRVQVHETPFAFLLEPVFSGGEVTVTLAQNVSFGPTELARSVGIARHRRPVAATEARPAE